MWAEDLVLGVPSLALGAYSLVQDIRNGDTLGAAVDVVGMLADAVAIALPVIPGGAGLAIKAVRAAKALNAADRAANAARSAADAIGGVRDALENGLDSCDMADKLRDLISKAWDLK